MISFTGQHGTNFLPFKLLVNCFDVQWVREENPILITWEEANFHLPWWQTSLDKFPQFSDGTRTAGRFTGRVELSLKLDKTMHLNRLNDCKASKSDGCKQCRVPVPQYSIRLSVLKHVFCQFGTICYTVHNLTYHWSFLFWWILIQIWCFPTQVLGEYSLACFPCCPASAHLIQLIIRPCEAWRW